MVGGRIRKASTILGVGGALAAGLAVGSFHRDPTPARPIGNIRVHPSLEHRLPDGSPYTSATQSLLRGSSWLEEADTLVGGESGRRRSQLELIKSGDAEHYLRVENLPLSYLVPRLHYVPAEPPDRFDSFNLMMAEYSRNGLSVPRGTDGDEIAHYETSLEGLVPWKLAGDFEFRPNPEYMPQRFAVINNCLAPGLWELAANDRAGEIYHAWFEMPAATYFDLVAESNELERQFVEQALEWSEDPAPLALGRLRRIVEDVGEVAIEVADERISYSSQDSRRKIMRQFALVDSGGTLRPPERLSDFLVGEVAMSTFVPPGIYSSKIEERSRFDFGFLSKAERATVSRVEPLTSYRWTAGRQGGRHDGDYIEITIDLGDDQAIVLGNLPLSLLVRQEDFVIHGFGVGILSASGLAERRRLLIERGPRPSFAYLVETSPEEPRALNSHSRGVEQIFIRSWPEASRPHWQITITSYERIVDLIRYRVEMPTELVAAQRRHSSNYITPIYLSYRDDNVN